VIKPKLSSNYTRPRWIKPKQFDNNLVVIGAGSAGLVSTYIAAAVRAKVTLIEKHQMGGDCLNTGCVPSKALIRSARLLAQLHRAGEFGLQGIQADFDFASLMQRVQGIIQTVAPHDSIERYEKLGVNVILGDARIISPWQVEVTHSQENRIISTRAIVIAAGARPFIPSIPGLDSIDYLTSDTIWNLREKPKRLLVLGGGPIGCELAQCFARLGCQVTLVEMASRLLSREDKEASEFVLAQFQREKIDCRLEHKAKQFTLQNNEKRLIAEYKNQEVVIGFDQVLLSLGRIANTSGYGLEAIGVELSAHKTIQVNAFQATNYDNIFACGDVSGPFQFTHTAAHQAWYASVNALFGGIKKFRTDYSVIPWATFTDPEVARVGLNEQEAKQQSIDYEVSRFDLAELDRAIADSDNHGFIKVLTPPGKDKILGVTIVGAHAGDSIAEFVLAMKHQLGLNKILGTIHIYPTWAEANKYVAGVWKRQHQPETLLKWLSRFHTWRRKG
jgi:pyruvate/2-oxoglutarate dehydrogenase complex dihydrolipoamide dehydrogenase (E3) component